VSRETPVHSLYVSVTLTGATESQRYGLPNSVRATRRSRTGDLLITNSGQGETEKSREELSEQKTEDQD